MDNKPLTPDEIVLMREACKLASLTLIHIAYQIQPGITTQQLDEIARDFVTARGGVGATLNYKGFPKSICTSINGVICHGVPDGTILKDGDIINLDTAVLYKGFYGDTSGTYPVGEHGKREMDIINAAEEAMMAGIKAIQPHGTTGDIGFAINKSATRNGFWVVKEIGGHGVGRAFHEHPHVPSFGKKGRGDILVPWTCITVEPMLNETAAPIVETPIPNSQHFVYSTSDGSLSAQFEHTVLITDNGWEILT